MQLDNILVVADRNDTKLPAVRTALDLLAGGAGRLTVVGFAYEHAVEEPGVLSPSAAATVKEALLVAKRRWLDENLAALPGDRDRVRVEVVWAKDIVDWIVEAVPRERIDLVVKTGNRSESLFHAPSDWQLLRRAPVPVLIAGKRMRRKARRILAAVDAASGDAVQVALNRKVLAAAAQLGAHLGAEVHVAHVIAVSAVARDLDLIDTTVVEREQRQKLGPALAALAAGYGIPAQQVIMRLGSPDRVLVSIAAELAVDIVVMGTVGRAGVAGLVLGNTAEQVLHRLRTGLLAMRPD